MRFRVPRCRVCREEDGFRFYPERWLLVELGKDDSFRPSARGLVSLALGVCFGCHDRFIGALAGLSLLSDAMTQTEMAPVDQWNAEAHR